MQINLPAEPALPTPTPASYASALPSQEARPSFDHYLDAEKPSTAPKPTKAKDAERKDDSRTEAKRETKREDKVEDKDDSDAEKPKSKKDDNLDPNTAAALAALAAGQPVPLPPPPVATASAAASQPGTTAESAAGAALATNAAVAQAGEEAAHSGKKDEAPAQEAVPEEPMAAISTSLSVPRGNRGTAAAMDRSAMPNALLNSQVKAKAAGISIGEKTPVVPAQARQANVGHGVTPAAVRPVAALDSAAPTSTQPPLSTPAPTPTNAQATPTATPADAATKAARLTQDVSVTLDHVERMTENLHATGRKQMELEVNLHDDSKITISLQMNRGELKATFKTDSAEMREALAQNWGQVADKNADRSIRLNPPVFESSESRNGFSGDARQQSRDGRPAQTESEGQAFSFRSPAKTPATVTTSASTSAAASASSALELYA